jgi:hypothetical protein
MTAAPNIIEVTAGEVADELKHRGISSDDIDRLIKQAQHEVEPKLG